MAPISLPRDDGAGIDAGVVMHTDCDSGCIGFAGVSNLSAGSVLNDSAGLNGATVSLGGDHSACSSGRCNGGVVGVGVSSPGIDSGISGVALVVNLAAGSIVNDGAGS